MTYLEIVGAVEKELAPEQLQDLERIVSAQIRERRARALGLDRDSWIENDMASALASGHYDDIADPAERMKVARTCAENRWAPDPFALLERCDGDVFLHGCVKAPPGKGAEDMRLIYDRVMGEHPDEWDYDQIIDALIAEGFTYVHLEQFWE